jgi:hypothetical protein
VPGVAIVVSTEAKRARRNKEKRKMTRKEIYNALDTGARAVKDVGGCCGIVRAGNWEEDIRKDQFGNLMVDPELKVRVNEPGQSVYRFEVSK